MFKSVRDPIANDPLVNDDSVVALQQAAADLEGRPLFLLLGLAAIAVAAVM